MDKKKGKGRPRIGRPTRCISLTVEQERWLTARIPPGGSMSATIRAVIQQAMADDAEPQPKAG